MNCCPLCENDNNKCKCGSKKKADRYYWICDICASLKSLVSKYPNGGNTMTRGECDWCGLEGTITPVVDFVQSGDTSWD